MNVDNNIYEFPDVKKIVVCGDIHGDFRELVYKVCVCECMHDTLVIVAGDCGFGFEKPGYYENIYKRCKKRLEEYNNLIVFVRGNHDNPAYFDGQQVNYERWKAVQDYSVLKACGHTILCVGGAVTMERTWRESSPYHHFHPIDPFQRDLYWSDEAPVYDQAKLEAISKDRSVDVVVTHTAPSFCEPKEKRTLAQWTAEDPLLPADVQRERKVMNDIHSFLKENGHFLEHWFYGHFHASWHNEIEGVRYNMLDIMEVKELI
jgi:predicted phosphodiesterase